MSPNKSETGQKFTGMRKFLRRDSSKGVPQEGLTEPRREDPYSDTNANSSSSTVDDSWMDQGPNGQVPAPTIDQGYNAHFGPDSYSNTNNGPPQANSNVQRHQSYTDGRFTQHPNQQQQQHQHQQLQQQQQQQQRSSSWDINNQPSNQQRQTPLNARHQSYAGGNYDQRPTQQHQEAVQYDMQDPYFLSTMQEGAYEENERMQSPPLRPRNSYMDYQNYDDNAANSPPKIEQNLNPKSPEVAQTRTSSSSSKRKPLNLTEGYVKVTSTNDRIADEKQYAYFHRNSFKPKNLTPYQTSPIHPKQSANSYCEKLQTSAKGFMMFAEDEEDVKYPTWVINLAEVSSLKCPGFVPGTSMLEPLLSLTVHFSGTYITETHTLSFFNLENDPLLTKLKSHEIDWKDTLELRDRWFRKIQLEVSAAKAATGQKWEMEAMEKNGVECSSGKSNNISNASNASNNSAPYSSSLSPLPSETQDKGKGKQLAIESGNVREAPSKKTEPPPRPKKKPPSAYENPNNIRAFSAGSNTDVTTTRKSIDADRSVSVPPPITISSLSSTLPSSASAVHKPSKPSLMIRGGVVPMPSIDMGRNQSRENWRISAPPLIRAISNDKAEGSKSTSPSTSSFNITSSVLPPYLPESSSAVKSSSTSTLAISPPDSTYKTDLTNEAWISTESIPGNNSSGKHTNGQKATCNHILISEPAGKKSPVSPLQVPRSPGRLPPPVPKAQDFTIASEPTGGTTSPQLVASTSSEKLIMHEQWEDEEKASVGETSKQALNARQDRRRELNQNNFVPEVSQSRPIDNSTNGDFSQAFPQPGPPSQYRSPQVENASEYPGSRRERSNSGQAPQVLGTMGEASNTTQAVDAHTQYKAPQVESVPEQPISIHERSVSDQTHAQQQQQYQAYNPYNLIPPPGQHPRRGERGSTPPIPAEPVNHGLQRDRSLFLPNQQEVSQPPNGVQDMPEVTPSWAQQQIPPIGERDRRSSEPPLASEHPQGVAVYGPQRTTRDPPSRSSSKTLDDGQSLQPQSPSDMAPQITRTITTPADQQHSNVHPAPREQVLPYPPSEGSIRRGHQGAPQIRMDERLQPVWTPASGNQQNMYQPSGRAPYEQEHQQQLPQHQQPPVHTNVPPYNPYSHDRQQRISPYQQQQQHHNRPSPAAQDRNRAYQQGGHQNLPRQAEPQPTYQRQNNHIPRAQRAQKPDFQLPDREKKTGRFEAYTDKENWRAFVRAHLPVVIPEDDDIDSAENEAIHNARKETVDDDEDDEGNEIQQVNFERFDDAGNWVPKTGTTKKKVPKDKKPEVAPAVQPLGEIGNKRGTQKQSTIYTRAARNTPSSSFAPAPTTIINPPRQTKSPVYHSQTPRLSAQNGRRSPAAFSQTVTPLPFISAPSPVPEQRRHTSPVATPAATPEPQQKGFEDFNLDDSSFSSTADIEVPTFAIPLGTLNTRSRTPRIPSESTSDTGYVNFNLDMVRT
jgi:hypothetical protein